MDSKKIEAIEVVYQRFLKSLFRVWKKIDKSIVLAEFGKFPIEHFAWGQALLYYNYVSMVSKNHILGKAWETQLAMLDGGKKCWARSMKKMATLESTPGGGKFFASSSTIVGNGASTYNDPCVLGEDCSIVARNSSWNNAHTFNPSSKGKRLGGKPNTLVQCAQHMGGSSGGWGPTFFRFSPHNVECKKGEG